MSFFSYEGLVESGTFIVDSDTTLSLGKNYSNLIGKVVSITNNAVVGYGSYGDVPFGVVTQVEKDYSSANNLVATVVWGNTFENIPYTGAKNFKTHLACDGEGGLVEANVLNYNQKGDGSITLANTLEQKIIKWSTFGKTTQTGTPSTSAAATMTSTGSSGKITHTVSDGGSNRQTLDMTCSGGFHGVKTSSGGNYTDSDGQKWYSNERQWDKGNDIIWCELLTGLGSGFTISTTQPEEVGVNFATITLKENINKSVPPMCDRYKYSADGTENGMFVPNTSSIKIYDSRFTSDEEAKRILDEEQTKILVVLASSKTQEIPAGELNKFKKLKSYEGKTVVSVTDNAGIDVTLQLSRDPKKKEVVSTIPVKTGCRPLQFDTENNTCTIKFD